MMTRGGQLLSFILLVTVALLVSSCCLCDGDKKGGDKSEIQKLYDAALADARNPRASRIVNTLVPIYTPPGSKNQNPALDWGTKKDQAGHVLMVNYTRHKGYGPYENNRKPYLHPVTTNSDIWVYPEKVLRDVCTKKTFGPDNLTLRLNQYSGLPPDSTNDRMVLYWVKPVDLFRPCPDPEIDDTTCGIDFPAGVGDDHRKWINDLRAKQYFHKWDGSSKGYPWTQLGYTYDWGAANLGSPTVKHVGGSEYIIRKDSDVWVEKVVMQDDYCEQNKKPPYPAAANGKGGQQGQSKSQGGAAPPSPPKP